MSPLIKIKKGALKDTTRKINLWYKIRNRIVYNKFVRKVSGSSFVDKKRGLNETF